MASLPVRLCAPVALVQVLAAVGPVALGLAVGVVAAADLERVEVELRRELVEQALEPEGALDEARRAERPHRRRVHLRAARGRLHVRAGVEHLHRALDERVPAEPADRVHVLAAERGERAVGARTGDEPLDRRIAVAGGDVLLATRERAAHRPPGARRERGGDQRVVTGVRLRAEAAAHELADDPHPVLREPHHVRDLAAHAPDVLRRGVHLERLADPAAHAAVRLERVVEHGLRAVGRLDDDIGLGQAALEVAALTLAHREHLAARDGLVRVEHRLRAAPTRPRSARPPRSPGRASRRRRRRRRHLRSRTPRRARGCRRGRSLRARRAPRAPARDRSARRAHGRAATAAPPCAASPAGGGRR